MRRRGPPQRGGWLFRPRVTEHIVDTIKGNALNNNLAARLAGRASKARVWEGASAWVLRHSTLFLTSPSFSLFLSPQPRTRVSVCMRARMCVQRTRVESVCTTVNVCSRSFEYSADLGSRS